MRLGLEGREGGWGQSRTLLVAIFSRREVGEGMVWGGVMGGGLLGAQQIQWEVGGGGGG